MNKRKMQKTMVALAAVAVIGTSAGYAVIANAQTPSVATSSTIKPGMIGPHVVGTIKTINGTTLTLTGKNGVTYTVNASNANVEKGSKGSAPVAGTLADLKAGDVVVVEGTITGTDIVAKEILSGVPMGGGFGMMHGKGKGKGGVMGERGEHGVHGTVTAVNGNTITVTKADGTVYTVDAGTSQISKVVTITTNDIKVGDTLGVHGTVSGTSVKAVHIMDGQLPKKDN